MQSILDQLQNVAAAKRDEIITAANNGADDDLPIEDRPNRSEVSPGCVLKHGDQIEVFGDTHLYLCPGRGQGFCYTFTLMEGVLSIGQAEAQYVTDRIPADPLETPMPILPPAAPPPAP